MEKASWIKKYLIDTIPFIAVLLYILAIVYELAFFSVFDIGVLGYISLTETLISIIEPLVLITLYSSLIPAGIILLNRPYRPTLPRPRIIKKLFDKIDNYKLIVKVLTVIPLIIIYVLYSIIFLIVSSICSIAEALLTIILFFKDTNFRLLVIFIFAFVFFLLSFCIWQIIPIQTIQNGMSNALEGLLWPLNIVMIVLISGILSSNIEVLKSGLKRITLKEGVFLLVLYYVFAILVFCYSGFEYGNKLKKNDTTVFTIQMTDGTIFDNTKHGYINKMGNYFFLYEKQSNANVILYNESIKYMKIKNDDSRKPLLYYFIKKGDRPKQERKNNNVTRGKTNTVTEQHKKDEAIEAIKQNQKKVTIQQKREIM